jgi:hypothetical protein
MNNVAQQAAHWHRIVGLPDIATADEILCPGFIIPGKIKMPSGPTPTMHLSAPTAASDPGIGPRVIP